MVAVGGGRAIASVVLGNRTTMIAAIKQGQQNRGGDCPSDSDGTAAGGDGGVVGSGHAAGYTTTA